ncbi:cytochrome-c oxidase [Spatholobus suberectus]|nr:cytochrome-c oxidase [Spatholobus suberectus]
MCGALYLVFERGFGSRTIYIPVIGDIRQLDQRFPKPVETLKLIGSCSTVICRVGEIVPDKDAQMMLEAPFRPREKLVERQKYFQNIHRHTYLKGPFDKVTSVAIPLALAASSIYLIEYSQCKSAYSGVRRHKTLKGKILLGTWPTLRES